MPRTMEVIMIQNRVRIRLPWAKKLITSDSFMPAPVRVRTPRMIPATAQGMVMGIILTAPSLSARNMLLKERVRETMATSQRASKE